MTEIFTVGEIVDRLRGMNIHMYKEGEVSCVYTYTHTVGEPLEICCVSASPEDQVYAPPVCTNRDPMKHSTSSASGSANRESKSPSNKMAETRQVSFPPKAAPPVLGDVASSSAPPVLISPQGDMANSMVEMNGQLEDLMERIQRGRGPNQRDQNEAAWNAGRDAQQGNLGEETEQEIP